MATEKLIALGEVKKKLTAIRQYFSGYPSTDQDKLARAVVKMCIEEVDKLKPVDAAPVVHGRWVLEAHEENANCRWNVTAQCSECHHSKGEVYAGFFLGIPKDLAKEVVIDGAKTVKLDNFCPNCGAKMDGERRADNA